MKPVLALLAALFCAAALAQTAPEPSPIRLPELKDLKPPPAVRALGRALGGGRQRLALVISHGRVGDLALPALRQALAEFRSRLGPRGAGLIYVAGAGIRRDGQSRLLTRGLDAAQTTDPAALRAAGLPLQELVEALLQPQATGPDALRNARRLAIDGTGGRQQPWLGGRTDEDDELGETDLLQTLLPATPEDAALKAVKQLAGVAAQLARAEAAPAMNPFGYAAGDSFTYRRIDQWKGEVVGIAVQLIEQLLPDGEMLVQDEQGVQALDAQGRVRSRSGDWGHSEFQPVEEFFWSRPKRGESRDVKFTEYFQRRDARGERHWEGEGWYTEINALGGRRSVMWERTVWYSPELGHPVAVDIVERDAGSRLLRKERLELLRVQNSRTVP